MKTKHLLSASYAGILCMVTCLAWGVSPVINNYNVYYGSLHNHTSVSDGTGTPDQAYNYAKNTAHLDFFGLADHSNLMSSSEWTLVKNAANATNQDGVFAAFYGFEWTTYLSYGHVAVVNTDDYCSNTSPTSDFAGLLSWLNARDGIAFFNHPGWDGWAFREFEHFAATPSDRFAGMELWNDMDGFGKYYYNDGFYSNDGNKSYYDEALVRGWKTGAAGADDNHDADWGTSTPFRVGVLAKNLTRAEILDAFKARRIFSTTDKNISLSFRISGAEMGSTVTGGYVNVMIEARDQDPETFTQAVLMKNGAVLKSWSFYAAEVNLSEYFTCNSGDYLYVRVKEADGGEAISSPVWISGTANQPPAVSLTSPVNGTAFKVGDIIPMSANASDADGSVMKVEFYQGSDLLGSDTSSPYEFQWTGTAPGAYSLNAVAYDNQGATAVSSPVSVTVTGNQLPVVSLTSPADGATFRIGETITINATASDPDGTVVRVDFYQGSTLLGSVNSSPYAWSWTATQAGPYTFSAIATDNLGASATSPPVFITVSAVTPGVINAAITAGSDDAEEYAKGTVLLGDADIDLVYDSKTSGNQTVGLFFRNLNIPAGATINKAYIQFTSYLINTAKCSLTIKCQKSNNPADFANTSKNLSSRSRTTASVSWKPSGWVTAGTKGTAQQTSDLAALIREITTTYPASAINNLVFIITGTGTRTAYSYETSPGNAAVLHVEYIATVGGNSMKSAGIAVRNPELVNTGPAYGDVDVQLYPDPVYDKLSIRLTGDACLRRYAIYSIHGVRMLEKEVGGLLRETSVDCSSLAPGLYLISVETDRGTCPLKFVRQ